MAGRSALQSLRAGPIHKQFKLTSSSGSSAVAVVARLARARVSQQAARSACDVLFTEAATSLAGDGDWTVRHSPNAAPRLFRGDTQSEFRISAAHSANWVAVGLATDADIGVDVQVHRDLDRAEQMAELLGLRHRELSFFDTWVLREAIAKATHGSVLTPHAIEAQLVSACEQRGNVIRANDFATIVDLIEPTVSFSVVVHHSRAMQHCA